MSRLPYLVSFVIAGCLTPVWADDPVVFRSDVSLVRVEAQVVDRDNRTITGLGPRDFVLREGGQVQKIQSVDSENVPIDLLLLLDVSASMRPHIQRISSASHEAMRQLRDDDRAAIMVFDRSTRVRMGFRNSRGDVERELERLLDQETFRGGTDITLGLMDAASFVRREGRPEARKAIVIVTDDETEFNRDVDGVSRALTRADAVLNALIAPDAMGYGRNRGGYPGGGYPGGGGGGGGGLGGIIFGQPRRNPGGYPGGGYPGGPVGRGTQSAGTREIALRSGGDSMPVDDYYALQDTLARIRQRYALHFYLPPGVRAGDERQIQLELADATRSRFPGADLRYRRSYYAPAGAVSSGGTNSDPVVVTRAGSSDSSAADDPDRPRLRRAVSQPDSDHSGPLLRDPGTTPGTTPSNAPPPAGPATTPSNAPPPAGAASDPNRPVLLRRADPDPQAAPAPQPAPAPSPDAPGWRKARPDELPN
jgi:VWFA-related protein